MSHIYVYIYFFNLFYFIFSVNCVRFRTCKPIQMFKKIPFQFPFLVFAYSLAILKLPQPSHFEALDCTWK